MKKLIVITWLITVTCIVMGSMLEKADETKVLVSENHVEIRQNLYDSKGEVVILTKYTEHYGLNRINSEIEAKETELLYWTVVDPNVEQARCQTNLVRLYEIKDILIDPNRVVR